MARRPVVDLLLAQASNIASSLVVTFVTAAVLGAEGRGEVAFVLAVGSLAAAISFGSLHMSVVHAEERGHGDARRTGLVVALASAAAAFSVLAVAAVLSGGDGALTSQLLWAACGAFLGTVNLFVLRLAQALGQDSRFRDAAALQGLTFAALGCAAVYLTREPRDVYIAWIVSMIASTAFAARGVEWSASAGAPTPRRRMVTDAWSAHVGTLGVQVLNRANIVALGVSAPSSEVGLYSVAAPLAEATWILSEALSLLAFRAAARSGPQEARRGGVSRQLVVTASGALAVALGAAVAIPVFLPDFEDAVPLIFVLLPGVVVQGLARVAMARLAGHQRNDLMIRIGAASAVASLLYVPAASHGAMGMAVTASVLYVVQGLGVLAAARRSHPPIDLPTAAAGDPD